MKKKSATQRLEDWILSGKAITPLQALNKFGIFRLGARIYDLRRKGYNIATKMVRRNDKEYAQYKLAEQ